MLRDGSDPRFQDRFWLGADLVVEVVGPDGPERDLVEKRVDYAEAGIPEYWIVDPRHDTITVLTLADSGYVEHGVFSRGESASSPLLGGIAIDVTATFDATAVAGTILECMITRGGDSMQERNRATSVHEVLLQNENRDTLVAVGEECCRMLMRVARKWGWVVDTPASTACRT